MERCSILWCGKYQQNWENKLHSHSFCQLFAVTSGSGIITIRDNQWAVQPGEIYLVKPDESHSVLFSGGPLGIFDIKFNIGEKQLAEAYRTLPGRMVSRSFDRFNRNFERIVQESLMADSFYFPIINHCLYDILVSLVRESRAGSKEKPEATPPLPPSGREVPLAPLLEYIGANYTRAITLNELCTIASFNKTTLTELFKEQIGTTPIRYVNQIRLNRAKFLLAETGCSVSEAAAMSGFQSIHYFCRIFKATQGCSPAQYRRANNRCYFFQYPAGEADPIDSPSK